MDWFSNIYLFLRNKSMKMSDGSPVCGKIRECGLSRIASFPGRGYKGSVKFLAIDYGLKRTGIAVSDPEGWMAFPRRTVRMSTRRAFFAELEALVAAERPDALVVGLPLLPDGGESLMTRQARHFTDSLARRVDLPIYWMPEMYSSHEAECDLREAGRRESDLRAVVDQQAAVCILESFLNTTEEKRIAYVRHKP